MTGKASRELDSEGRKLSEEQQEFFRDSIAVTKRVWCERSTI